MLERCIGQSDLSRLNVLAVTSSEWGQDNRDCERPAAPICGSHLTGSRLGYRLGVCQCVLRSAGHKPAIISTTLLRRDAEPPLEVPRQVALVAESGDRRDFGDRLSIGLQQVTSTVEPSLQEILVWGDAQTVPELRQIRGRDDVPHDTVPPRKSIQPGQHILTGSRGVTSPCRQDQMCGVT